MASPIYFFTRSGCGWCQKMKPSIDQINETLNDEQKIQIHSIDEQKSKVIYDSVIRMSKLQNVVPLMYNSNIGTTLLGYRDKKDIQKFENIGADIGLLFQVADDLIDYNGTLSAAGKKTGKDKKKGQAPLISLLGDKNTIKYANNLILKINTKLKKYGPKSQNLTETLNYILNRNK